MPEVVHCPRCERKLRVPEELYGKSVKCPTCGSTFTATVGRGGEATQQPTADVAVGSQRTSAIDVRKDDRLGRAPAGGYHPHRGTIILVFAILGLVACPIFGPVAWIMGNSDMTEIRAGRMDPEGENLTNIGRIIGIIATALGVLDAVLICCLLAVVSGGVLNQ
jgi:hypothetical protein